MLYFYLSLILGIVSIQALWDAEQIRNGTAINHRKESLIFGGIYILCAIWLYFEQNCTLIPWLTNCAISSLVIRIGWFDFLLNALRNKSIWYISPNADGEHTGTAESWYDDLLTKIRINPNVIRMTFFLLSILWVIFNEKILPC